jgi:hypothetical protein
LTEAEHGRQQNDSPNRGPANLVVWLPVSLNQMR